MLILQALYFFLPAYLANMAPVFIAKILGHRWETPIDFGKTFRGHRIFGDHKTWRGLIAGTLTGVFVAWIQSKMDVSWSFVDFQSIDPALLGGLLGFGALAGDAIKSFFKRQIGIPSGEKWPLFDQLDFVAGGLLAAAALVPIPWIMVTILVVITPALHKLSNVIGYNLKLKSQPW